MLIIIFLAIWVAGAICYFAWRLMPSVPKPGDGPETAVGHPDADGSDDRREA